jgi:hypothetical protein
MADTHFILDLLLIIFTAKDFVMTIKSLAMQSLSYRIIFD